MRKSGKSESGKSGKSESRVSTLGFIRGNFAKEKGLKGLAYFGKKTVN